MLIEVIIIFKKNQLIFLKVQFKLDFPEEKLDNGPEKKRKRVAENGTTRNGKKNFAFYGKVGW